MIHLFTILHLMSSPKGVLTFTCFFSYLSKSLQLNKVMLTLIRIYCMLIPLCFSVVQALVLVE